MGIAITLCFVAGLVCAMIASGKGRSFPGWFVIGMLLPLVGVVLILALPGNDLPFAVHGRIVKPQAQDAGHAHLQTTTFDAFERLVQLKDRGHLSDLEFQQKRAELLARI